SISDVGEALCTHSRGIVRRLCFNQSRIPVQAEDLSVILRQVFQQSFMREQETGLRIFQHISETASRIFDIQGDVSSTCLEHAQYGDNHIDRPWKANSH